MTAMRERVDAANGWLGETKTAVAGALVDPSVATMAAVRISGTSWGDWNYDPEAEEGVVVAFGRGRNDVHRRIEKRKVTEAMITVREYLRAHPDQPLRHVTIVTATGLANHTVTQAIYALTYHDPCVAEGDDDRVFYNTEMSERSDDLMRLLLEDDEEDEFFNGQEGGGL